MTEKDNNWKCHKCGSDGYKTDGESNVWCKSCLDRSLSIEPRKAPTKIKRNDPCK